MQQLTGTDATFLNIETPTTHGHVSGLILFDPTDSPIDVTFEELKELIEARLHLVPLYRRKLVEVPLGLDQPYWIEDPHFDLDFHVRHLALPAPGSHEQLVAQVERIVARPLDRSRPLWELYLIEGLEGGLVAQLSKIHHCAIDGVSGAEILASMLDLTPTPREVEPPETEWKPEQEPSDLDMLGRTIGNLLKSPARGLRLGRDIVRSLPAVARSLPAMPVPGNSAFQRLNSGPREALGAVSASAPRVSFNGTIGAHRRFAFGSIPLDDVKTIKRAFDVTINDVVLALCSGALRRYLDDRGELPDEPLVAMVPVSTRAPEEAGTHGNQITSITTPLHTHVEDPIARLQSIHASMVAAKEMQRAIPAHLLQDIATFSPPAVAARAARAVTRASTRWIDPPYNLIISNVPGPQFPLYGGGARMVANHPISAITDGAGLNITVTSYDGSLDVGIIGCRDLVPDVDDILAHMLTAVDELKQLSTEEATT